MSKTGERLAKAISRFTGHRCIFAAGKRPCAQSWRRASSDGRDRPRVGLPCDSAAGRGDPSVGLASGPALASNSASSFLKRLSRFAERGKFVRKPLPGHATRSKFPSARCTKEARYCCLFVPTFQARRPPKNIVFGISALFRSRRSAG
jgi:hypothetical protein